MRNFLFPAQSRRRFAYRAALFLGDGASVAAALWSGFHFRFGWLSLFTNSALFGGAPVGSYFRFQVFTTAVLLLVFLQSGLYRRLHVGVMDEFLRVILASLKGWLVVFAATYVIRDFSYSRLVFAISAVLCVLLVILFRTVAKVLYRHVALKWWEPHRVLVVGGGKMCDSVMRVLRRQPGFLPESATLSSPKALREFLERNAVREVFAGAPELSHVTLMAFAEVCEEAGVPFKIIPDLMELRMGEIVFDDSLGLPSFTLRPASLTGSTFLYKRVFDVVLSVAVISLLFVPFAFLAFLISADSPGPVFFRQWRVGLRGRRFLFFKFRSMVADAERRLHDLKSRNERAGPVFKIKNDPRVTRVGRWLRKLSLDEFPQLLNVLRGEMSLVGPRPQLPSEISEAGEISKRRMNVLPGITGLWQVSGRAHLSYEQMVELDTYYIEHWSPGLDLTILLKTLPAVLGGHGAY